MITLSKQTKREPLLPTLHKLYDTIQDAFNSEYLNTFEDIILLSQNAFLTAVSANAMKYLHDVYQHNELFSTFAKETIKQVQNEIHMQYIMHYTSLSNAFKKYSMGYNNKVNYLTLYRRHCPFTDEVPCHNCTNKEEYVNGNVNNNNSNKHSLIEVKPIIQDKQITFVICTLCKKCFFANRILLWCRNCKCDYYSSLLGENEQFNLLPATWERYHCRNTINETMKCIQCKSVFYLNLITKKLECSNSKCALVIDPHSILWNCIFCKQDFSSEARIFNPLEVNLIKQSINKAIIRQIKVYPHKLPCCVCSDIKMLKFYHKRTCKGQLYEGMFNHNKIVVCSKCNAMNFYDKFIWTCPLCNVRFRLCESKGSSIVDSIRKSSDSFYSMFDKRNASTITSSPTVNKGNASLSLLSSHLLNTSSILNLNKTTSNYNYDSNKCKDVDSNSNNNSNNRRIPLSSVSSTNNSARVVLNLNNINKREPCYSTLIDIMKRRNFAQKFTQFSYSSSLSSNHSVLRGKALSRTESTIKNCIDNKSKSKTATSNNNNNNNTSSTKQDHITNTPNNHILTSNITKFHNANLSQKASSGRNTSDSSYKSIPPKIIKRPKKIAINLFESFNKAEEENDMHPLSTKARMFANNHINYNITLFDSPLTGKNKRVNGTSSTRNTFYEHNSNSKEDTIRHIYQLRAKNFNAYSNLKTHSKGLTGSSGNVHNNNKTNIPNSKMILINKQQKRTNKLTYKGVTSDKIKEQDNKQQGMTHSAQNVNTKQIDNTIESHRENEKSNSQSTTTTKRVGMPSMEQQSSILLNEILSTSIIPFFNIENFKLLNPIGEGSYGKIYCIQDLLSKSKYALKKIIAHDIQEVKTYQTEFELVYSYTHPNIMKIYNIQYKCLDFSTFSIYVLMELATCDWNVEIKRKIENQTLYKESELIIMLYSLIKALSFLQKKNIAHRDIKPQNILLYPNNKIKVADFGEAKEIKIIKQQNTLKGTEMYMSPILYNAVKYNKKNVEHNVYKSDVFSLGFCFLYAAALNFKILSDLREIKDMKEIRIKIGKYLNKRYSSKLINAIIKMVEYNENERVDFIEMEKYIKDNLN